MVALGEFLFFFEGKMDLRSGLTRIIIRRTEKSNFQYMGLGALAMVRKSKISKTNDPRSALKGVLPTSPISPLFQPEA